MNNTDRNQLIEEYRKGPKDPRLSAILNNPKLFFQLPQLIHADVVASANHNDYRAQALWQLALILKPLDDVTVHSCQSSTAGWLHQHLLIICGKRRGEIRLADVRFSCTLLCLLYSPTKRSTALTASWSVTTSEKTACSSTSFIVWAETRARPSVVATLKSKVKSQFSPQNVKL